MYVSLVCKEKGRGEHVKKKTFFLGLLSLVSVLSKKNIFF